MSRKPISPERRQQYLTALGIVDWRLRRSDTPEVVVSSQIEANVPDNSGFNSVAEQVAVRFRNLEKEALGCTRCALHETRNKVVFGSGNVKAEWMFVGEAPGREEDRQGEAFVGRAGQLLNAILFAFGLDRDRAYIANVLKCRPPGNRDPHGEEVVSCESLLHRQVELVKPLVIIALGRFAAQSLLKTTDAIGRLRGRVHRYTPFDIPLVVTYHPAYLLRSPSEKRKVWADLCLAHAGAVEAHEV